jgi:hypothetical protein
VLVVSSDHRLHKAARRRGATAVDSDAFLDQLEDNRGRGRQPSVTPGRPSLEDELTQSLANEAEAELKRLASEDQQVKRDSRPDTRWPSGDTKDVNDPDFWRRRLEE